MLKLIGAIILTLVTFLGLSFFDYDGDRTVHIIFSASFGLLFLFIGENFFAWIFSLLELF